MPPLPETLERCPYPLIEFGKKGSGLTTGTIYLPSFDPASFDAPIEHVLAVDRAGTVWLVSKALGFAYDSRFRANVFTVAGDVVPVGRWTPRTVRAAVQELQARGMIG